MSAKTFLFSIEKQIEHLCCIFDEYQINFGGKKGWKKIYEFPNINRSVFSYIKYCVIETENERIEMFGIIQLKEKRMTVAKVIQMFAEQYGIFKNLCMQIVSKPMILPRLKYEIFMRNSKEVIKKAQNV